MEISVLGFVVTIATVLVTFGSLRQQLKTVIDTVGNADSGLVKKVNQHDVDIVSLRSCNTGHGCPLMEFHTKHGD